MTKWNLFLEYKNGSIIKKIKNQCNIAHLKNEGGK